MQKGKKSQFQGVYDHSKYNLVDSTFMLLPGLY